MEALGGKKYETYARCKGKILMLQEVIILLH